MHAFQTAERIRVTRSGREESQVAVKFLKDFTEEEFVMLSMMSDAADEAYQLTCHVDMEDTDMASQAEEVANFTAKCEFLFVQCSCEKTTTYTKFALSEVQKLRVLNAGKVGSMSEGFRTSANESGHGFWF